MFEDEKQQHDTESCRFSDGIQQKASIKNGVAGENLKKEEKKKILIAFYSKIKQTVIQASHSFPIPSMKPHSNLLIRLNREHPPSIRH